MPWNLEAAAWSVMSHVLLYSINTFHTKKIQPYKGHIDCDYFLYHLLCSLFFICMCVNLCLCNFIFVYRLLYWNENIAALLKNIYTVDFLTALLSLYSGFIFSLILISWTWHSLLHQQWPKHVLWTGRPVDIEIHVSVLWTGWQWILKFM